MRPQRRPHPSRCGEDAAPQDEVLDRNMRGSKVAKGAFLYIPDALTEASTSEQRALRSKQELLSTMPALLAVILRLVGQ